MGGFSFWFGLSTRDDEDERVNGMHVATNRIQGVIIVATVYFAHELNK